ncbi:immunoglobulin domain-containing protein [Horticoccus luteus]|uniref:Immunoglobulin domain-containing protein n=1 Tax=Horticoccus luteus TaxID=2862869 RepID=A0A8F9XG79_9BACT|nr:immunoglobulin domain-containing protein [Horticoccus luteus]QYM77935.1 immunoglobulin domain-containing protein [Horticoccus luteus]
MFSARLFGAAFLLPFAVLARDFPSAPPPAAPAQSRAAAAHPMPAAAEPAIYSIDGTSGPPTDEETLYVEYVNRARMFPAAEGTLLRNTTDPQVVSAYNYFHVDLAKMESEFQALTPLPPVAFNALLTNDARGHTQDMFDYTYQGHEGPEAPPNASTITSRALAAGYNYQVIAENVYSFADSPFHGHAGFEVDWGTASDGMQPTRGHRANIHNSNVREIGVGVVIGTKTGNNLDGNPTTVGPQLVSQEFGTRAALGPLLTGVAYFDLSGDHFYSIGEGLGQVTVTVEGASYSAVTAPSGAFTVPLPGAGTYTVTFTGPGLSQTATVTSASGENVKLDFTPTFSPAILSGPATIYVGTPTAFSIMPAPGATGYLLTSYLRDLTPVTENAENADHFTVDVSGYNPVQTSVKSQGNAAFNLKHPSGDDQVMTLNRSLFVRAGAQLTFSSRLCIATAEEIAKVQISTDEGTTWTDIYSQAGPDQPGETSFTTRTVDLSAYADHICLFRFRFDSTGSYYPSTGFPQAIGWFIDAIAFSHTEELLGSTQSSMGNVVSFNYTAPSAGSYLLALTPENVTRHLPVSAPLLITATPFAGTPASIVTPPVGATVNEGGTVTLTVGVTGSAPFTYQWQKDNVALTAATSASLTLSNVTVGDSGSYTVTVTNGGGSVTSSPAVVGVNGTPPSFSTQPQSATITVGDTITLTGSASGTTPLTYQWQKDGVDLPGATTDSLTLANTTAANSGTYRLNVTNSVGTVPSAEAIVTVNPAAPTGDQSYLSNLSVRAAMVEGQTLIVGFVVDGGSKPILVRAAGPALNQFGLTGVADPRLTIYNSQSTVVAANDDWASSLSGTFAALGAFSFPPDSKDAALLAPLAGPHTAQVTGIGDGAILVEAYDAGINDGTKLVNLSARFHVGTGADILIAGFVLNGTGSKSLLIRAVGPTLAGFGVPATLADPKVAVFDGANLIAQNDDWSATLSATFTQLGAFPFQDNSKDAALIVTLAAGKSYTVQVSGVDNGTGEALVEIYAIP